MSQSTKEVVQSIAEDLANSGTSHGLGHYKINDIRDLPRSSVGMITLRNGPLHRHYVIKILPNGRTDELLHEFDKLSEAYRLFSPHTELAVPQPIRSYPRLCAFVMERAAGVPATRFLSRLAMFRTERRTTCASEATGRVAKWLTMYRVVNCISSPRETLVSEAVKSVESRLIQLESHSDSLISQSVVHNLRQRFTERVDSEQWSELMIGTVHRDFGCHNIFMSDDQITVIDLGDSCCGFVIEDACRILLELCILDHSRKWRTNRELFEVCRNCFCDNYGIELENPITQFFTLKCALMFYLTIRQLSHVRRFRQKWHGRAAAYLAEIFHELAEL